jgi:hypothetical protein
MSMVTTNQKNSPMPPENRRTFVKKSVATSVSISFVGLIRAAHGEETPGTTTTTFDPQQTTSPTTGQTTTFDPQQTTSPPVTATTTTVTTTPPVKKPALTKGDPVSEVEEQIFESDGTGEGVVTVTEDKGNNQLEVRYQGKIKWKLSYKMEIPPAETKLVNGTHLKIPKTKDCVSCLVKDIKLEMVVSDVSGPNWTHGSAIQGAINTTLDTLFNDSEKCNAGDIFGNEVGFGVSVTAIQKVISGVVTALVENGPVPNDKTSDDTKPVIMKLSATVAPVGGDSPSRNVTFLADFDELQDFNEVNFKALAKTAVESAVIGNNNGHRATTLTFPTLGNLMDEIEARSQNAVAHMTTVTVAAGGHCANP